VTWRASQWGKWHTSQVQYYPMWLNKNLRRNLIKANKIRLMTKLFLDSYGRRKRTNESLRIKLSGKYSSNVYYQR
jgi:hypothetical protein